MWFLFLLNQTTGIDAKARAPASARQRSDRFRPAGGIILGINVERGPRDFVGNWREEGLQLRRQYRLRSYGKSLSLAHYPACPSEGLQQNFRFAKCSERTD